METLKALVSRVARAFYEPKFIVVLDYLNRSEAVKDEEMSQKLGIAVRDIHKLCGKLKEDRLIRTLQRSEARKPEHKPVPKTYYYIDYKQFVDVVKWKMYQIRFRVGERMRNEIEQQGYICRKCGKTYSPLDISHLVDPTTLAFNCEVCNTELVENDNADNVKGSQESHGRLMEQSQPVISLLKLTDGMKIPASTPKLSNMLVTNGQNADDDKDIDYAKDSGASMGDIMVVFPDENEATKKANQAESEKKRQQNALPAWHQRSTVSGEPIILEATAKPDAQEQDEVLDSTTREAEANRERYYIEYYATLREQHKAVTVSADGELESEEEFEAVEIKLNRSIAMQESRQKRGHDSEEDSDGKHDDRKRVKTVEVHSVNRLHKAIPLKGVNGHPKANGVNGFRGGEIEIDMSDSDEGFEDGFAEVNGKGGPPFISVKGNMIPMHEVTEEHRSAMTAEEYQAYFDIWQRHQ